MNTIATRRLTAATMASAAILAGAGFTALGSIFNYPKILQSPAAGILAAYRQHGTAISAWFLVLVLSAALLGPAGVGLGRLAGGRTGKWIAATGIAAALVQITGLSRWVLFVPGLSDDALIPAHRQDAYHRFQLLHTWLGTVIGETWTSRASRTSPAMSAGAHGWWPWPSCYGAPSRTPTAPPRRRR